MISNNKQKTQVFFIVLVLFLVVYLSFINNKTYNTNRQKERTESLKDIEYMKELIEKSHNINIRLNDVLYKLDTIDVHLLQENKENEIHIKIPEQWCIKVEK